MSAARPPTRFGRIHAPDEAWLARRAPEPILEPELPIVDTHHHLWDRPDHRYLLDELLADLRTGHDVTATVRTAPDRGGGYFSSQSRAIAAAPYPSVRRIERPAPFRTYGWTRRKPAS